MQTKVPMMSIVGKSNSGKTTLIVKLVQELKARGYKVGTVKHSHHNFELDKEGKDSWLHSKAGADAVVVASKKMTGILRMASREIPLPEIVNSHLHDMDIILAEGYKNQTIPKIEVLRSEVGTELLCKDDQNLTAVVGDTKPAINIPFFPIGDEASPIVDFLLSRLKKPLRKS